MISAWTKMVRELGRASDELWWRLLIGVHLDSKIKKPMAMFMCELLNLFFLAFV